MVVIIWVMKCTRRHDSAPQALPWTLLPTWARFWAFCVRAGAAALCNLTQTSERSLKKSLKCNVEAAAANPQLLITRLWWGPTSNCHSFFELLDEFSSLSSPATTLRTLTRRHTAVALLEEAASLSSGFAHSSLVQLDKDKGPQ